LAQLPQQDRRDEIAGDDEEDVDADEATGEVPREEVKQDDRDDREGSQPVNLGAIGDGEGVAG